VAVRPKDHGQLGDLKPEPVCPDCAARRAESKGRAWWCERHDTPAELPHAIQYSSLFVVGKDPVHTVW
jgi:tRNA(Ile2) C34 agmatinyltransferase TiaS